MPLPLLAGIPWLAGVIGALFVSMFTWLVQFVTKKIALTLAALAVLLTVTTAFFAAIEGLLTLIVAVAPTELTQACSLILPTNTTGCLTAVMSAHLLRWVYGWQVRIIQYKMF